MVGDCKDCRKWEDNMYWSHFQTVQFCQFLTGRFDQQLAIPKKFADSIRDKMAGIVDLRGPSGHVWNVDLVTDGDILLLKNGWKTFVEDHSLVENNILIFKYNGNSRFDVSFFDQESLCEKASSYFVKKCEHREIGHGDKRNRSFKEGSKDTNESSDDVVHGDLVKRRRSEATSAPPLRIQPTHSTSKAQGGNKKGKQSSSSVYHFQLKSRRSEVTEDEKYRAHQMAVASSSERSFTMVMRASHVYKGFFMSIPAEWARVHLPKRSQEVKLRVNDNTWVAKYQYKGNSVGLSGGWKKFVLENFLEEFDVCVFDLGSGTHDTCTLDVKIFRVVEEVIPPSRVTRGPSRRLTSYMSDSPSDDPSSDDPLSDEDV
ncbi:hypothetical protein DH2020_004156 [Rehmannia glutinosa]|uniref:TF-B3 domain-containing protein n=1 Tax=Rehmannia glutinosa TaxID=99300 RepID=A0ABR0XP09_REHGL